MNYCGECGARLSIRIPKGDHLPRSVCDQCNTIHYQNPKIVAGCIPTWNDKILFCKRAIEPRWGLWTLPAGFMENKETTAEAAARETREEANAIIENMALYSVFSLPHISQVYMMYRGQLKDGLASPGEESLEVALLNEDAIPWDRLAFPVIEKTLRLFLEDRRQNQYRVHNVTILKHPDGFEFEELP
ncbi:MAG TPA: NUDIX domain-containing protein [Acidiferrobacteraceae bacterium]|nr:NUDIX domain-containing protein [Acidiferrobacteraceae bacterium]